MLDKNYILGLVDGEGSFNVRVNETGRRARVELKFSLKLRHQDKEILHELEKFFGCGKVYIQRDKRENHSLCYRFEVQNKKDIIEKIVPFFTENPPLIPSRKTDFELFKKIVELSQDQRKQGFLGPENKKCFRGETIDFEEIKILKQHMHWGSLHTGKPSVQWKRQVT